MGHSEIGILELAMHGIFASIGGFVRELKEPEHNKRVTAYLGGAMIGMFTGIVVFFMCVHFNIGEYLTAALTGLGGYSGAPLLDSLSKSTKKFLSMRFGK